MKIILAEDHHIVRHGVKVLLETDQDLEIIAEAIDGQQVLDFFDSGCQFDIVLSDINMPLVDGISLISELKNRGSNAKVIILTMHENEQYVQHAFQVGASGYLFKSVKEEELIYAIKHVYSGGYYLCSDLAMNLLKKNSCNYFSIREHDGFNANFNSREIEVLELIADGFTNQQMSEKLFLSKRTIEGHRQSLIDKSGAANTASLVSFALRNAVIK